MSDKRQLITFKEHHLNNIDEIKLKTFPSINTDTKAVQFALENVYRYKEKFDNKQDELTKLQEKYDELLSLVKGVDDAKNYLNRFLKEDN